MTILELLQERQTAIKERWKELIIATYPADSRGFFLEQKNRFLNPVGGSLSRAVDTIYDRLLDDECGNGPLADMEEFIKVRAVQDFEPSQAVGFILYLKEAIREQLADAITTQQFSAELVALETRIDRLVLQAFDFYMLSREKICEIRANEFRRRSYLALRRAQADLPGFDTDSQAEVTG
ncbi:MAG TPA: RsbRD N-terminal domain-containing protein [bacterium]|jgi:hypothetical protein